MPLPSFLRRKKPVATPAPEPTPANAQAAVAQARTRARRRLIGAVVLLGVGVIAFPLLFETEPRPIPVDLPIEIPNKLSTPPLAMPPAHTPAAPAAPPPAAPVEPPAAPSGVAAAPPPAVSPGSKAAVASAPATGEDRSASSAPDALDAQPEPAAAAAARRDDGVRAQALLQGQAASAPAARYVVQIGAFASSATVREVRAKADKARLQTYTQTVKLAAGEATRVRVGPFDSRAEADAAAAQVRKVGLPATVLKL